MFLKSDLLVEPLSVKLFVFGSSLSPFLAFDFACNMMRGVSSMDLSDAMGESNGQLRSKHLEAVINPSLASSPTQCLTAAHALVTRGIERSDSEKTLILGEEIQICPMPFKSAALDKFKVQALPDTCLNMIFFLERLNVFLQNLGNQFFLWNAKPRLSLNLCSKLHGLWQMPVNVCWKMRRKRQTMQTVRSMRRLGPKYQPFL